MCKRTLVCAILGTIIGRWFPATNLLIENPRFFVPVFFIALIALVMLLVIVDHLANKT